MAGLADDDRSMRGVIERLADAMKDQILSRLTHHAKSQYGFYLQTVFTHLCLLATEVAVSKSLTLSVKGIIPGLGRFWGFRG